MSQEDINKNKRIVDEILDETGHKLKAKPETEESKAEARLLVVKQEVTLVVKKYYEDHPIGTVQSDLAHLIMSTYLNEFYRWNKDDLIYAMCLNQTSAAMKYFGY